MEYVTCPNCGQEMTEEYYESTHKYQCRPKYEKVRRITSEEEIRFPEALKAWKEYVLAGLQAMVKDEENAVKEYADLSKALFNMGLRSEAEVVSRIAGNEAEHKKTLEALLRYVEKQ